LLAVCVVQAFCGVRLAEALRHSAASYLSALYGNAKAADICGHDVRTAGVYYRAATTPEIAQEWFSIYPEK
ncbi:MAG: hypothetical protein LUD52_03365, partial [Opitutae bacterium]|nr:hypothetical protein [Opitutae bacterium]